MYTTIWDKQAVNQILTTYKNSAKIRKLEFNLSYERFRSLISGSCKYCGTSNSNERKINRIVPQILRYNGIDRVDNQKGYIEGNVVSCCKTCNFMKRTLGVTDFISHITLIHLNSTKQSNELTTNY